MIRPMACRRKRSTALLFMTGKQPMRTSRMPWAGRLKACSSMSGKTRCGLTVGVKSRAMNKAFAKSLPPLFQWRQNSFRSRGIVLLGSATGADSPVLSIWQSDIIYYGSNLREFLLLELSGLLGLDHQEVARHANQGITEEMTAAIPFWGELMFRD